MQGYTGQGAQCYDLQTAIAIQQAFEQTGHLTGRHQPLARSAHRIVEFLQLALRALDLLARDTVRIHVRRSQCRDIALERCQYLALVLDLRGQAAAFTQFRLKRHGKRNKSRERN